MQPVSLLSRPQTQKCLHTVAKKWEHNESHAKWQRRRGKRWALVGKKRTANTGKGEETVGEEGEAGHSERRFPEMVDWKKWNKDKEGNKNELRNVEKAMWEENKFDYVRRDKEMKGLEHFFIFFLEDEEVRIIKEQVKPNNWEGEGKKQRRWSFQLWGLWGLMAQSCVRPRHAGQSISTLISASAPEWSREKQQPLGSPQAQHFCCCWDHVQNSSVFLCHTVKLTWRLNPKSV